MKDDEETSQFEMDLGPNVTSFSARKSKKINEDMMMSADTPRDEFLEQGLETFAEELSNGAKGFFAIVLDAHGNPSTIAAGELDTSMLVFALEVAKNELLKTVFAENVE